MDVSLRTMKRTTIATQLLLISPAALFMTSLLVRNLQPLQHEPANTAQQIVLWYSGRLWTLWVLLIALPLTVLVMGCATLLESWNQDLGLQQALRQPVRTMRSQLGTLLITATTLTAGCILVIVAAHMLAN